MNHDLQYQNGIDFHLDWGASHFLSKNLQIGMAGYYFQQLTGDSGPGAKLGDFKGRVLGFGPQVGFLFPVGKEHAVTPQPEGLPRLCRRKPPGGLHGLGYACDFACRPRGIAEAGADPQIALWRGQSARRLP